jgi:hypothetical protein
MTVCLSIRRSVCVSVRLSACLSVRLSVHLFVCLSVCPSVCLSVRIGQLCSQMYEFKLNKMFQYFSKICEENSNIIKNLTKITGTLHENLRTFMISRSVLLRIRNVYDKSLYRTSKHAPMFNTVYSENCAVFLNVTSHEHHPYYYHLCYYTSLGWSISMS